VLSNNVNDWQQLLTLSVGLTTCILKHIYSFSAHEACPPTACPDLSFHQSIPCTLYALHLISQGCSCHENFMPFLLIDWLKE